VAKHQKTNAVRLLEAKGIAHEIFTYEAEDGVIDAVGVAGKLGLDPSSLFKTLVARAERNVYVYCIPGNAELDLKKAAKAAGEKKVELVAVKELLPLTGYIRGGCSPVGMKKAYPLFLEETAVLFDAVVVSGGAVGMQIRLAPTDLADLTGAVFADLTVR